MEPSAYQRASDLLRMANAEEAGGDRSSAMMHVQKGIEAIGSTYRTEDTLDDTGMRLVLAMAEERKGNLDGAFRLRKSVLENRLALLGCKESAEH